MTKALLYSLILLMLTMGLMLSGCGSRQQVRHLSSDVCLITPNLTRQEVLNLLGQPDTKGTDKEQYEVWFYYQVKEDFLRKAPYMGDKIGTANYDLVTITFAGEQVRTCLYRALTEKEFRETGLTGTFDSE